MTRHTDHSTTPLLLALLLALGCGGAAQAEAATPSVAGAAALADCSDLAASRLSSRLPSLSVSQLTELPSDAFASGFSILEGPVWFQGALYVSQINANDEAPPPARILKYEPGKGLTVVVDGSGSNGLELAPNGRLAAARHIDGSVSYVELRAGATPEPIAAKHAGARFNSPNDLTFHPNGTLYFTDPDWQAPTVRPQAAERAYFVLPGGTPEPITAALTAPSEVRKPNGVLVSSDHKSLYLGGQNGLFRFSLDDSGRVSTDPGQRIEAVTGGVDGMTLDCAGNMYVTTGAQVLVLDSQAHQLGSLQVPRNPTNVTLGGTNGRTLFITTLQTTVNDQALEPNLYSVDLAE